MPTRLSRRPNYLPKNPTRYWEAQVDMERAIVNRFDISERAREKAWVRLDRAAGALGRLNGFHIGCGDWVFAE